MKTSTVDIAICLLCPGGLIDTLTGGWGTHVEENRRGKRRAVGKKVKSIKGLEHLRVGVSMVGLMDLFVTRFSFSRFCDWGEGGGEGRWGD